MNINNLPDDCLLHIFNIFHKFGTLLNCSQVCERWKYLVLLRLSNVKYLADYGPIESYPVSNTILYENENQLDLVERLEWFPKLKIIENSSDPDCFSNPTVEGFLFSQVHLENFTNCNPSLKMLAIDSLCDFFANDIQGPMLNQLHLGCPVSKFSKYAKYFPNLKRLHIVHHTLDSYEQSSYTGPTLEKLEILEVIGTSQWGSQYEYRGFSLADKCPVLKSAYHYIDRDGEFYADSGIKNHFLEDLVIQLSGHAHVKWSILRRVLYKYPNLKHLAIRRGYDCISHENVLEIVHRFPHITLIDIRDSKAVNENTTRYIEQFCLDHNRSISLYYQKRPKITKKWSHLSTKKTRIGREFDFMKHCFLKEYCNDFPYLLDSDE